MNKQKAEKSSQGRKGQAGLIAACLVMSVIVFLILLGIERNMLKSYEKGSVLVVKQEIPERTLITAENAETYFELREVEKTVIPDGSFLGTEELLGCITAGKLERGVIPTASMVEEYKEELKNMQEPVVAGILADDIYQLAGGTLRAGDKIHIYAVDKEGEEAKLIRSDVSIVQAFDSAGAPIEAADTKSAVQRINIYLEKENVEALYSALASGSLRVVKALE